MLLGRAVLTGSLVAGLLAATYYSAGAADPDAAKKAAIVRALQRKQAGQAGGAAPAYDPNDKDGYPLPEGGVKELLAFIKQMQETQTKLQQEMTKFQRKGMPAIQAAAEKIQKIATAEDRQLEGFGEALGLALTSRIRGVAGATEDERAKLIQDMKDYLTTTDDPPLAVVGAVSMLARSLEANKEEAVEVYRDFGAILARSKNPEVAKMGEKLQGSARRLDLVGNQMEVVGTKMDGSKFDWNSYRGKVVLVDFWATWCGPCRAEMPNVKKNYDLYHDKGFEVVGISLDKDREALEKFLENEKTAWTTIHDGDWAENANAIYYGVTGIPTVILVDKEGKVVSTQARGPELGRMLAELLGPVEEKTEDATK